MSKLQVIYVAGLGDARSIGQRLIVKMWSLLGVRGHYVPMRWAEGKKFEPKLQQLLNKIDELAVDGQRVGLIGASAGASPVLVAYAQRRDKVNGVVCICGKINNPEGVNPAYYRTNPSFKEALTQLQEALPKLSPEDRYHIMSIHPLKDETVPIADTIIRGARQRIIWCVGHALSIGVSLTLGAPMIMHFLKRQTTVQHPKAEEIAL